MWKILEQSLIICLKNTPRISIFFIPISVNDKDTELSAIWHIWFIFHILLWPDCLCAYPSCEYGLIWNNKHVGKIHCVEMFLDVPAEQSCLRLCQTRCCHRNAWSDSFSLHISPRRHNVRQKEKWGESVMCNDPLTLKHMQKNTVYVPCPVSMPRYDYPWLLMSASAPWDPLIWLDWTVTNDLLALDEAMCSIFKC